MIDLTWEDIGEHLDKGDLNEWLKDERAKDKARQLSEEADTPQTEQRNRSTAEFITGTQIGDPQPLPNGITTWASSSDEPQTDCETCKYGQDKHRYAHICNECGVGINNYTPQTETQMKTQNSNLTFEKSDCPWK